jgi:hypothetical protein
LVKIGVVSQELLTYWTAVAFSSLELMDAAVNFSAADENSAGL